MRPLITDFRALMTCRFLWSLIMTSQAVMVGWLVYDLTKSPWYLGLIGLVEAVPAIGLALFSGYFVDQGRPHAIYRWVTSFSFINSIVLTLVAANFFELETPIRLTLIFVSVFVFGIVRSLLSPALFTLVSHAVSREEMIRASAVFNGSFQLGSIIGPALAGVLFAWQGPLVAFSAMVLIPFVGVLIALAVMNPTLKNFRNNRTREPIFQSIGAGIRYVFEKKEILSALTLDMFSVLFGGVMAILPMYSDQVLQTGAEGLGFLRASFALGAVLSSIYLIANPMREIRGKTLLWVVAGFGACMLSFGLMKTLTGAMAVLFVAGSFDSISMTLRAAILQLLTPEEMKGRVSSVNYVFINSSNQLGELESGIAAGLMGLIPSIFFGGAMTVLIVGLVAIKFPELRRFRISK